MQIDLKTLRQYDDEVEDLLDGIIANMRREEDKIPPDKVIRKLKKSGKLK